MKSITLLLLFVVSLPVFADGEMRRLIDLTHGNIYAGSVPAGYRTVKLSTLTATGGLKTFVHKATEKKIKVWKDYVFTSGEYSNVSNDERRRIASNPLAALEVKALLEFEEVYAIYQGNKLIGYFVQINDYVQSAIYQDGAWYDVFVDTEMNIVEALEQSA